MEEEPDLDLCLKILTETYSVEVLLRKAISALSADEEFISIIAMQKILDGVSPKKKNNDDSLSINSLDFGDLLNILEKNFYDIRSADIFSQMENDLDNLNSYKEQISRLKHEQTVWDVIKHFVIEKVDDKYVELPMVGTQLDTVYEFRNKAAHFRLMNNSAYDKVLKAVNHIKKMIVLKSTSQPENFVDLQESLKIYQSSLAGALVSMQDVSRIIQPQIDAYRNAFKDLNIAMQPQFNDMKNIASLVKATIPQNLNMVVNPLNNHTSSYKSIHRPTDTKSD